MCGKFLGHVAGFARIQSTQFPLNSCESSYFVTCRGGTSRARDEKRARRLKCGSFYPILQPRLLWGGGPVSSAVPVVSH